MCFFFSRQISISIFHPFFVVLCYTYILLKDTFGCRLLEKTWSFYSIIDPKMGRKAPNQRANFSACLVNIHVFCIHLWNEQFHLNPSSFKNHISSLWNVNFSILLGDSMRRPSNTCRSKFVENCLSTEKIVWLLYLIICLLTFPWWDILLTEIAHYCRYYVL